MDDLVPDAEHHRVLDAPLHFGDTNSNSFRCFTNGVAGPNNWVMRGAGLTDVYVNVGAISNPTMTTFVYDPALGQVRDT